MKKIVTLFSTLTTVFAFVIIFTHSVGAQAAGTGQALEIAPPVLVLSANPGQTIQAKLMLRDVSKGSLIVTNEINDFTASGEDGTPKILVDQTKPGPYSIKDWVEPISELTLQAKQLKNLNISINIPKNVSPGGYFGVIRFTAIAPELKGTGVALSASLGALVMVKVNGMVKEDLSVESFYAAQNDHAGNFFEFAPIQLTTRVKNTGNMYEQPSGQVVVTDMFNKKVVTLGVNQPPRYILPQTIRKFTSTIDSTNIGDRILFGLYHAKVTLTYADKQTLTQEISFWVIPYRLILLIIVLIVIVGAVLYFLIKHYNNYIISRAQKSPSKHKKK